MNNKTTTDPVCGMELETKEAKASSVYKGTTYYFCETDCKTNFDKNPERYINTTRTTNNNTGKATNSVKDRA